MKYAKKQQGFTLVELIVAMSLFSIIVVVISGIFMQTVKFQKIVANRAAAIDNLGLAMEEMARGVRTGVLFDQLNPNGSSVEKDSLEFIDYKGQTITYSLGHLGPENNRIMKFVAGDPDDPNQENYISPLPITSSNVKITNLKFILQGKNQASSGGINIPPRITISMTAKGIYQEPFTLQTTVGARLIYYKTR